MTKIDYLFRRTNKLLKGLILQNLSIKNVNGTQAKSNKKRPTEHLDGTFQSNGGDEILEQEKSYPGRKITKRNSSRIKKATLTQNISHLWLWKIAEVRLKSIIEDKKIIEEHQFGFKESLSARDQRIIDIIENFCKKHRFLMRLMLHLIENLSQNCTILGFIEFAEISLSCFFFLIILLYSCVHLKFSQYFRNIHNH